jgi:hypothetical protein
MMNRVLLIMPISGKVKGISLMIPRIIVGLPPNAERCQKAQRKFRSAFRAPKLHAHGVTALNLAIHWRRIKEPL